MGMYCPYTGKRQSKASSLTREHIVPLAAGGHDSFSFLLEKGINDRAGAQVDAPFLNDYSIMNYRVQYGLKGHSGKEPELRTKGVMETDSGPIDVELVDKQNETVLHVHPCIKIEREGKNIRADFIGTSEKAHSEFVQGVLKKMKETGKKLTNEELVELKNPKPMMRKSPIKCTVSYSSEDVSREIAKVILGFLYYYMKEIQKLEERRIEIVMNESIVCKLLRNHLWAELSTKQTINSLHATFELNQVGSYYDLHCAVFHVVGMIKVDQLYIFCNLFSEFSFRIPLSKSDSLYEHLNIEDMLVVDFISNNLYRCNLKGLRFLDFRRTNEVAATHPHYFSDEGDSSTD